MKKLIQIGKFQIYIDEAVLNSWVIFLERCIANACNVSRNVQRILSFFQYWRQAGWSPKDEQQTIDVYSLHETR